MWRFPELDRPTVFVAAPGDLGYLRKVAAAELGRLQAAAADDDETVVYDWMVEKSENGFDDWLPAQGQLPLPTDPYCRAVICAFGARLGTPLPADFPLAAIGEHASQVSRRSYGALVRWDDSQSTAGRFPITGTVFEYLAVLAASQRGADEVPPVLLLFVGDDSIADDTEYLDANWGGGKLHREAESRFKPSELRRWENERFIPQVAQLRNFLRYVEDQGVVPRIVPNEPAAAAEIRHFLARHLGRCGAPRRDPFKALESYDAADSELLFGRRQERRDALAELQKVWADSQRPNALCVLGGSGSGKSSFLKAGVFADLCNSVLGDDYHGFVLLPKDLDGDSGGAEVPPGLAAVLRAGLDSFGKSDSVPMAIERLAEIRPERLAETTLEILLEAAHRHGQDCHLLVAVDQFEEVVDPWLEERQESLRPLLEFLLAASRNERSSVLYTLQLNRAEALAGDPLLGSFFSLGGTQLLGFPRQSLRAILERPFELCGLRLEHQLVRALEERVVAFAERGESRLQGSLLPLVSLALSRLYNANTRGVEPKVEPDHERPRRTLRLVGNERFLDIERVLSDQATAALREARKSAGSDWSEDALGDLLRKLVRIRGSARARFGLPVAELPEQPAQRALAEALARHRLILREPRGRIRLVHEAVLRSWSAAAGWVETERILLQRAATLMATAREWQGGGSEDNFLASAGQREIDRAAAVLDGWVSVLSPAGDGELDADDELLRRYALALLAHHPDPLRVVEGSRHSQRHVHLAATYGQVELVERYCALDPGSGRVRNERHHTPLYAACSYGHAAVVRTLLARGTELEPTPDEDWHPLHVAASRGRLDCLELLLAAGVGAGLTGGSDCWTALHLAAHEGHLEIVERLLVAAGGESTTTDTGWTALHLACRYGHLAVVEKLLGHGRVEVGASTRDGLTALFLAVHGSSPMVVAALLAAGADPSAVNGSTARTALHIAAEAGKLEIGRLLLAVGADPDTLDVNGMGALETVLKRRQPDFAELLLEHGASVDAWDGSRRTLLHRLARPWVERTEKYQLIIGSTEVCRFLLENGARADARDADDRTPLHLATLHGNDAMAELLLEYGAAVDAATVAGTTPLHLAARAGGTPVLRALLERGADADALDSGGWTALHEAAQEGRAEIVELLLASGCAVDSVAAEPLLTPLAAAAESGAVAVIEALLTHGADLLASTAGRSEPLLLALRNGQPEAARVLLKHRRVASGDDDWQAAATELLGSYRRRRQAAGLPASAAELALNAELAAKLALLGEDATLE